MGFFTGRIFSEVCEELRGLVEDSSDPANLEEAIQCVKVATEYSSLVEPTLSDWEARELRADADFHHAADLAGVSIPDDLGEAEETARRLIVSSLTEENYEAIAREVLNK